MSGLTLDLALDAQSSLEWYNVSSLRTMLRWRSGRWRDVRSKVDALELLQECLFDPSSIRIPLASLDPVARDALALLKRKGGAMAVAAMCGQIAVWYPALKSEQVRGVPSELVRRALAFWHSTTSHYGRPTMHDVQRPATDNFHSAMIFSAPEILDHVPLPPGLGETYLTPVGRAESATSPLEWQRRVLGFLRAIEARAPKILQSGAIGARDREALAEVVGMDEVVPTAPRLSAINFYRQALDTAGLLEITGDRRIRTSSTAGEFVSLSPGRQARILLKAWIESGENELLALGHLRCERRANIPKAVPDSERLSQAHRALVDLLREKVRPGQWYSMADVSDAIRQRDVEFLVTWLDPAPYRWSSYEYYLDHDRMRFPPYLGITLEDSRGRSRSLNLDDDWELVEGAFIRAVFRGPLTWLGLVECQQTPDGRESFALTTLGAQALEVDDRAAVPRPDEIRSHAGALVVQPNFDVVVYAAEERADLLYHVDRFAERVSVDRIAIYRLTRDSVCSGLQLGLRIDDVLRLLEGASQVPLPQNVVFTLRDWARRFEEIHWIRNAWVVEAPDPATLDRWLDDPEISPWVERRLSPTIALCSGARPSTAPDALARLGVDVITIDANAPLAPRGRVDGYTSLTISSRDAHLYLRKSLDDVAELVLDDGQGCRYQLTPQSVRRAVAAGATAGQVLDLLDRVVQGALPSGLRVRVKGWAGVFGEVAIGQVGILVAPGPEAFRDLRGDPALAGAFIQSISATAAIVDLDALAGLRSALAERGITTTPYAPPPRDASAIPVASSASAEMDGPDLISLTPSQTERVLDRALARGRALAIEYRQETGSRVARYVVRPREIHNRNGSLFVTAYCDAFQDDRDFRIANIVAVGFPHEF